MLNVFTKVSNDILGHDFCTKCEFLYVYYCFFWTPPPLRRLPTDFYKNLVSLVTKVTKMNSW